MADTPQNKKPGPDTPSGDYNAMRPYWDMVTTVLGGITTMKAAGEKYLPRFPDEDDDDYKFRRDNAKFTNIFSDIVENLAAKPFGEEVGLAKPEAVPSRIADLIENIDGKGNHVHVFAGDTFFHGIGYALEWIFVDYPKVPTNLSREQEKALNARPYWIHLRATDVIDVKVAMVGGVEIFIHARILEPITVKDGYTETTKERVRVIDRLPFVDPADEKQTIQYAPATYEIFEKEIDPETKEVVWNSIEKGAYSIGTIPLVPFLTGRRKGSSWQVVPPMKAAAELQVEHYQQETGLKAIKILVCYPMLAGNGVTIPKDKSGKEAKIVIGPKTVLIAPPNPNGGSVGSWTFIEPTAESLRFISEDVKDTAKELRELGRQPLTAQSGNLTVVTTAFAASKAHSAIEAWAFNLKDALENALKLTAMWLNETYEAEVRIKTDFSLEVEGDQTPTTLLETRKNKDLSQKTLWSEYQRRGILSAEFDAEEEEKRLADEVPGDTQDDIEAALTPPSSSQQPQNSENPDNPQTPPGEPASPASPPAQ